MSAKKFFSENVIGNTMKISFLISLSFPILFAIFYPFFNTTLKPWFIVFLVLALLFSHSPTFIWFTFFFIFSFFYFQPLIQTEGILIFISNFALLTTGGIACFLLIRFCLSFLFFKLTQKTNLIPKISKTEREAFLVGNTWIEQEFFTGQPNFKKLLHQEFPKFTQEEEDFFNKEVEKLCDLSKEWDLMKRKKLSSSNRRFFKKGKVFWTDYSKTIQRKTVFPFCPCETH